ncbi:MAG: DUF2877 domain-containing protein [Candidatus Hodarchaeales archaeon]
MSYQPYTAKILSYGDKISDGKYEVHSRFEKVINFIIPRNNDGRIKNENKIVVSVVKPEIGGGPTNIVIEGADFTSISLLEIDSNRIKLDNIEIIVPSGKFYSSSLERTDIILSLFERNINILKDTLINKGPRKSLVFIHDGARKGEFHSSFDKGYLSRFTAGYEQITGGKIAEGAKMIRGIGYGLTPSGDDFLIGFIAGLYLSQLIHGKNTSKKIELVCDLSLSENYISNTFLLMAKEGLFYEKLKNLCNALMINDAKDIEMKTTLIIDTGETSGADMLTGFLAVFDRNS